MSKKTNLILTLVLVALCLWAGWSLLLRPAYPGQTATVRYQNEVIKTVTLPVGQTKTLSLQRWGIDMELEFSPGMARVLHSNCPDKVCVNTGWLTESGQTAACLPNRVTLTVD